MSRVVDTIRNIQAYRLIVIVLLIVVGLFYYSSAYGADLPLRSLLLSDNTPGLTTTYILNFTIPASETLGSIRLLFCANDPLFSDPCTTPAGFDVSTAVLSSQTGETGFTISPATDANTLVLTRTPGVALAGPVTYTLQHVSNPSLAGTYYGRLQTFASVDASGAENDHGGIAFSMNGPISVNATVPPYLLFCAGITIVNLDCSTASGSYINFGDFNAVSTSSAQSQVLVATNAVSGYGMQVYGSTLTSGNNVINPIAIRDVSRPDTSQFGLNLVANQTPQVGQDPQGPGSAAPMADYGLPNWFQFVPGSTLATATQADSYKQFTISYITNISNSQTAGVYVATLTYVCLANF